VIHEAALPVSGYGESQEQCVADHSIHVTNDACQAGSLFDLGLHFWLGQLSRAAARFDARRQLIGQEANIIGTAYLRVSLLPESAHYVSANYSVSISTRAWPAPGLLRALGHNPADTLRWMDRAAALQVAVWKQSVASVRQLTGTPNAAAVTALVLQSLNEMIDITTTRLVSTQMHPPAAVFAMLIALVLVCSVLAGYGTRCWLHTLGFVAVAEGVTAGALMMPWSSQ
jgi:hypothetical protein